MKIFFCGLSLLLLAGCATSTVETRKKERPASYQSLSPENKALVDQSQIKVGMTEDAVYLAWGKPSQVLKSENARGAVTTWLYEGTYLQEYRYWSDQSGFYRTRRGRDGFSNYGRLQSDYVPQDYVSAEVNFVGGKIIDWKMRPRPQ
ncbi:MAG: hypothetical protein ABJC04_11910 [Verrucomicrobiota bacterium]